MQAMYDLVGDKISEIFDAQMVAISIVDEAAGVFVSPYTIERGVRLPDEPFPLGGGFSGHVLETPPAAARQCRSIRVAWPITASTSSP